MLLFCILVHVLWILLFRICFINFYPFILMALLSNISGISIFCVSVVCRRWFLESMFGGANFQKCNSYESYYFVFRHLLYPLSFIHTSCISFKYQLYQCFLLESVLSADNGFLNHLSIQW